MWDAGSRLDLRGFPLRRGTMLVLDSYLLVPTATLRGKNTVPLLYMEKVMPAVLLILALLSIAGATLFERAESKTWSERLSVPTYTEELSRHTPLHAEGTFLPPHLSKSTTLTTQDNPVILAGRTEVPAGFTLTLTEGVTVFAHEFAELDVSGNIELKGTPVSPVTLSSNERHPQNQVWNGIILQRNATADIHSAHFTDASPALSCRGGSQATVTDSEVKRAVVGIFSESPGCTVTNTRIEAVHESYVRTF